MRGIYVVQGKTHQIYIYKCFLEKLIGKTFLLTTQFITAQPLTALSMES